ncbi:hypothetical protein TYRP_017201 [Tyrophagus putrescentiae]|nr:hypothetical protein TYRP_017201 [Tyrophagus putrescentiae]
MGASRSEATIFTSFISAPVSFIRGKPKVETATEKTMKNRGQVSRNARAFSPVKLTGVFRGIKAMAFEAFFSLSVITSEMNAAIAN